MVVVRIDNKDETERRLHHIVHHFNRIINEMRPWLPWFVRKAVIPDLVSSVDCGNRGVSMKVNRIIEIIRECLRDIDSGV